MSYVKQRDYKVIDTLSSNVVLETKSLLVAYLLWLFGGFFGLHHLYLRRDGHAFFMFCTFGGYLGLCWITDAVYMPEYVRQFNTNAFFLSRMPFMKRPHFSAWRMHSQLAFSLIWGLLTSSAIPSKHYYWLEWTIPLFMSLAVWNMGNVGRHSGVWWHCGVAAYVTYGVLYLLKVDTMHTLALVSIISSLTFTIFSMKWRRKPCSLSLFSRLGIFGLACCVYLLLWWHFLYFNAYLMNVNDQRIPLMVIYNMLLKSKWWQDMKLALTHIYHHGVANGWLEVLEYDHGFGVSRIMP